MSAGMTMSQPPLGPRMPMRIPGPQDHGHFSSGGGPRPRLGYMPYRPYIRPPPQGGEFVPGNEYDGRRLRKSLVRKTVDYNSAIIKLLQNRIWQRDYRDRRALEPDYSYGPDTVPPSWLRDNSTNCVTTRYVKSATNKMRCPIFCMAWTPEGRRLITGASSGEFTLWNGLTFNFETILQAHDSSVRSMVWSHNDIWMVTGDHGGYVKYWQSNMNNVKMFQAHKEAVRGLTFSPSDQKFASCSDDGTVRVFDFYSCYEEKVLRGHGADVKCVDWHPHKGIIVSGSKDNQQPVKIWDPKAGTPLATLHAHKSTVMDCRWNKNGNWLLTASRDHLIKLFDIRKLSQEIQTFRGHKKEASCVSWNPIHENLFSSGGSDGSILFWNVGCDKEVGSIEAAHDNIIWTLAWHPAGHILCSGSNDHTSKFWTRQKPGDIVREKGQGAFSEYGGLDETDLEEAFIPGMGPEDKVENEELETSKVDEVIPGLDITEVDSSSKVEKIQSKKTPYQKPIPKKFQAIWNDMKVDDELDDEKVRNPLLPQPQEAPNSSIGEQRPDTTTRGVTEVNPGAPSMDIFNPNVGFGPMGAQYNPHHIGGPINMFPGIGRPPPQGPGPSPFSNQQGGNPFWTQQQQQNLGPIGMKGSGGPDPRKMMRPSHQNNGSNMANKRGRHR